MATSWVRRRRQTQDPKVGRFGAKTYRVDLALQLVVLVHHSPTKTLLVKIQMVFSLVDLALRYVDGAAEPGFPGYRCGGRTSVRLLLIRSGFATTDRQESVIH
jgi:hypothetical protein